MILFFTASCIAGGFLLGRYISRGHKQDDEKKDEGVARKEKGADSESDLSDDALFYRASKRSDASNVSATAKKADATRTVRDPFVGFPCRLGDVVMRSGGDEAWLAGAVIFDEATVQSDGETNSPSRGVDAHSVAALFVAPEAGADVLLYVRAESGASIWWMHALKDGEVLVGNEPPSSLEHGELRFERRRRLPLYAQRVGSGAPDVGSQVIVAEYGSGGYEQLLVVTGGGQSRAWRGIALETGMYEVIPSGASTLES